jgi:dephospho-CoA kinase
MKLIGLTGHRLSGKSLFAYYLRKKYGFRALDFSVNVLSPILRKQGKPVTRENLIKLATELRKEHGTDILARKLWEKASHGKHVISGIRFPEEVKYFKRMFGKDFVLISIKSDSEVRYQRIKKGGTKEDSRMTHKDFMRKDRLPTEKVISESMKLAKFSVTNGKTKKDFYGRIDQVMENIYKQNPKNRTDRNDGLH